MFKFAYSFLPFFQRLTWCVKINKPIMIKPHFLFSYQRLPYITISLVIPVRTSETHVSFKNGKYWIDPEKNGKPLKVYDMTTDGVKNTLENKRQSMKLLLS